MSNTTFFLKHGGINRKAREGTRRAQRIVIQHRKLKKFIPKKNRRKSPEYCG